MKTPTVAALVSLVVLADPLAGQGPPLPACQTIWPSSVWNSFAPCRLGQFTFSDWIFSNSWGVSGSPPPFTSISFALFHDHLDMTVFGTAKSYNFFQNPFQSFDFEEERFALLLVPDDPRTSFHRVGVQSAGVSVFDLPANASVFSSASSGLTPAADFDHFRFDVSTGCSFTGLVGSQTCTMGSGLSAVTPFAGAAVMTAQWQTVVSFSGPSTDPIGVSITNPTWTSTIYFTTPSVIPEPQTWVMLGTGLALIGLMAWRRRRNRIS